MTIHYHSDELLREHELLLEQDGDNFRLLDYRTLKPASTARTKALEKARRRQDEDNREWKSGEHAERRVSGIEDESYD